jgi:hypothetical protein
VKNRAVLLLNEWETEIDDEIDEMEVAGNISTNQISFTEITN